MIQYLILAISLGVVLVATALLELDTKAVDILLDEVALGQDFDEVAIWVL